MIPHNLGTQIYDGVLMLTYKCPECGAFGFSPFHQKDCKYYPHKEKEKV